MRIFDCFTFFNELELLKIRCEIMKELDPVHILVEATTTHTGDRKPLYFDENLHMFKDYNITDVASELPNNGDTWRNENAQRDKIMVGLNFEGAEDNDIVIISDLDEIPRPHSVRQFDPEKMLVGALKMDKFSYFLNCLEIAQGWESAKITTVKCLREQFGNSPQKLRTGGFKTILLDAGWHWSWLGGVDKIMEKFQSFAHQESNNSKFADPDKIARKLETGHSLWTDRDDDLWKFIPVDDYFPKYIQDNKNDLVSKGFIRSDI
jgi:beta-1,4-mannosyl-glycoprotein beta-1,4-N-acetylglucosaminyltransferase